MKKGTSLYLDLVRVLAALTVFMEHFREHTKKFLKGFWTSHPFLASHTNPYSHTAVLVFFVLCGYVIAHVLAERERSLVNYAASRLARLYSVVLPALVLVAVCNYLIELKFRGIYDSFYKTKNVAGIFYYI